MARPIQMAWAPSVEIVWNGRLAPEFRSEVSRIIGRELTDEQWDDLCRVVRVYSYGLNHEFAAATLAEQKQAVAAVLRATESLTESIELVNSDAMGRTIHFQIPALWAELRDRRDEHRRRRTEIAGRLARQLADCGMTEPESAAQQFLSELEDDGLFNEPNPPEDFIEMIGEFRAAVRMFQIKIDKQPDKRPLVAFTEFVGQLTAWATTHSFPSWASHSDANAGPFTALVAAVNQQIPEIPPYRDPTSGKVIDKQMRRPIVDNASLAKSINEHRRRYADAKPDGDN